MGRGAPMGISAASCTRSTQALDADVKYVASSETPWHRSTLVALNVHVLYVVRTSMWSASALMISSVTPTFGDHRADGMRVGVLGGAISPHPGSEPSPRGGVACAGWRTALATVVLPATTMQRSEIGIRGKQSSGPSIPFERETALVLLFDACCVPCADVAWSVRSVSEGRIDVAALDDEGVQRTLDALQPEWSTEPMLLERCSGDVVRVLRGWRMQARIVQEIGPVAGWRVRSAARHARQPRPVAMEGAYACRADAPLRCCSRRPARGWPCSRGRGAPVLDSANSTFVSARDPVIGRLRRTAAVRSATRELGVPDWGGVLRTSSGADEETYVLSLERKGQTVHLALQDPARDRSDTAVAFSVVRSGDGEARLRWMTPGGRLLATSVHSHNGVTTRARDGSAFGFHQDGRQIGDTSARVAGVVLACPQVPGFQPASFDAEVTADAEAKRLAPLLAVLERMRAGEADTAMLIDALMDDPALPDADHPQARRLVRRTLRDNAAVYLDPPAEVATQPPVADQLAAVRCPVLVLARKAADGPERAAANALIAGIPSARLIEIDARSLLINLECPQAFQSATRGFLTETVGT